LEAASLYDQKIGVDTINSFIQQGGDPVRFYTATTNHDIQLSYVRDIITNTGGIPQDEYEQITRDIRLTMLKALQNPDVILLLNNGQRPASDEDSLGYDITFNFKFLREDGYYGDNAATFEKSALDTVTNQINSINAVVWLIPGSTCVRGGKSLAELVSAKTLWRLPRLSQFGATGGNTAALGLGVVGEEGLSYVGVPRPLAEFVGNAVVYTPTGKAVKVAQGALSKEVFSKTLDNIPLALKSRLGGSADEVDNLFRRRNIGLMSETEILDEIKQINPSFTRTELREVFEESFDSVRTRNLIELEGVNCFPKGTKITLSNKKTKPIEEIYA
jgi:hypothetical protein